MQTKKYVHQQVIPILVVEAGHDEGLVQALSGEYDFGQAVLKRSPVTLGDIEILGFCAGNHKTTITTDMHILNLQYILMRGKNLFRG